MKIKSTHIQSHKMMEADSIPDTAGITVKLSGQKSILGKSIFG